MLVLIAAAVLAGGSSSTDAGAPPLDIGAQVRLLYLKGDLNKASEWLRVCGDEPLCEHLIQIRAGLDRFGELTPDQLEFLMAEDRALSGGAPSPISDHLRRRVTGRLIDIGVSYLARATPKTAGVACSRAVQIVHRIERIGGNATTLRQLFAQGKCSGSGAILGE